MKFNSLELKQIIKEELTKILKEEMTDEERAQRSALLDAVKKLNNKTFRYNLAGVFIPEADYKVIAEYKKGKDRHVAGSFIDLGMGLDFKITYDLSSGTYTIVMFTGQDDIIESGDNVVSLIKKVVSQAAVKETNKEIKYKHISMPTTQRYSSGDWERDGGSKSPSAKGSEIWGKGTVGGGQEYVALPYIGRRSRKWG